MSQDIYSTITDNIISQLEKGVIPWQQPFTVDGQHRNFFTGYAYNGINRLITSFSKYKQPYWLTLNQARKHKTWVKRSEIDNYTEIVWWKINQSEDKETGEIKTFPIGKLYRIYNIEQCDELPKLPDTVNEDNYFIDNVDKLCNEYFERESIKQTFANCTPHYNITMDSITLPELKFAVNTERYYATLFHEMGHSTGHAKRLNRAIKNIFGSESYSFEELVAELTSSFLCHQCKIDNTIEQSSAYIDSWLKVFRNEDNKRLIVRASSQAEKATNYILNTQNTKTE